MWSRSGNVPDGLDDPLQELIWHDSLELRHHSELDLRTLALEPSVQRWQH
jgi:hypothetical protein